MMDYKLIDKQILNKYNCEMDEFERIYRISFHDNNISLKHTAVLYFKVGEFVYTKVGWQQLVIGLIVYLSDKCNLLKFRPEWSNVFVFTSIETGKAHDIKIKDHLFLNASVLNNHLFLLIRDLVLFSKIPLDECEWKITRMPLSEPKEIRFNMIKAMKELVRVVLTSHEKDEHEIKEMFACLKAVNNRLREFLSTSYDNLYLITDKSRLHSIIDDFVKKIKSIPTMSDENKSKIEYYLSQYYNVFCDIKKVLFLKISRNIDYFMVF